MACTAQPANKLHSKKKKEDSSSQMGEHKQVPDVSQLSMEQLEALRASVPLDENGQGAPYAVYGYAVKNRTKFWGRQSGLFMSIKTDCD